MPDHISNLIVAATPGGIEAQERAGQIEQSFCDTLPRRGTIEPDEMGGAPESRAQWEALGFRFGNVVDELFVQASFPAGWRKRPCEHSMWSELLDDVGAVRAMIFYKAAFYDRRAHIHFKKEVHA